MSRIDASFISELNAVSVIRVWAAHKPYGYCNDRCLRIGQPAFFSRRWALSRRTDDSDAVTLVQKQTKPHYPGKVCAGEQRRLGSVLCPGMPLRWAWVAKAGWGRHYEPT